MDRVKEIDLEIKRLFNERKQILRARKRAKSKHPDLFIRSGKKKYSRKMKQGLLGL